MKSSLETWRVTIQHRAEELTWAIQRVEAKGGEGFHGLSVAELEKENASFLSAPRLTRAGLCSASSFDHIHRHIHLPAGAFLLYTIRMKNRDPHWWAWPLSFASLVILGLAVILVKVPIDQLGKTIRAREVIAAVHQRLYHAARREAEPLLSLSWGEYTLAHFRPTSKLIWAPGPESLLLIDIVEALRKNDGEVLRKRLDRGIVDQEPDAALRSQLVALRSSLKATETNAERLSALKLQRTRLAPEYLASRSSLRMFLGFTDESADDGGFDGGKLDSYSFYRTGVLGGLPRLSELDRELETLQQLREALSALGVKVKVTGPNPVEDFQVTIGDIRKKVSRTRQVLEQLAESEQKIFSQQERILEDERELRKVLRRSFESRLAVLLSPPTLFERLNLLTG